MKRLLLLLSLSALSTASAATVTLAPGQTGMLGTAKVTLLKVNDSRCPQGVMCVWAGELNATVLVSHDKVSRLVKLTLPQKINTAWPGLRILSATPKTGQADALKITFTDTPK